MTDLGASLSRYRTTDCEQCIVKDNLLVIVGSHRFSVEVLAGFISDKTPAKWNIVEQLDDVPVPDDGGEHEWRLIFVDSIGMSNDEVMQMLHTVALPYLKYDIVALFNLTRVDTNMHEMMDLGVRGFFFKNDHADFMLKGICALKNGEMWVARGALMEYVCQRPRKEPVEKSAGNLLTKREKQVLLLLATGATNAEISSTLFISPHTVKTHVYNILKKLGVQNRLQAALWASTNLS